jgi:hypothetical protein
MTQLIALLSIVAKEEPRKKYCPFMNEHTRKENMEFPARKQSEVSHVGSDQWT